MDLYGQQLKSHLQRISNILLINGGFLDNPGLCTGEMGVALFFFRYGDFTKNELYADYGFDLIEKVQNRINEKTPVNYMYGLSGIGSAIEYLAQYSYIEADTDDILAEFDEKIFDPDNLPLLPPDELFGIGYYALWRMKGTGNRKYTILKKILPKLVSSMEERCSHFKWREDPHRPSAFPTVSVFKELIETENLSGLNDSGSISTGLRLCRTCYPYGLEEKTYSRYKEQLSNDVFLEKNTLDLGLKNGLAGFGMSLMAELDGDDSWVYLLPADTNYLKNEPLPV